MKKSNKLLLGALIVAACIEPAFASSSAPWESGLKALQDSLTGPVASGLSLVGIVAAGAMLLFGGEISGFMKSIVYLVLVISMILFGNKILAMVGGSSSSSSGAVIAAHELTLTMVPTFALSPIVVKA